MKGVWSGNKPQKGASNEAVTAIRRAEVNKLRDAIADTVNMGAAIMFSGTRDGGAVVLTVLDGDARNKVYATNVAELDEALRDLTESFGTSPVASTGGARGRS